jgi:hypothetical protein
MYSSDKEKAREVCHFFKTKLQDDDYFCNKVELSSPVRVDGCPKTVDIWRMFNKQKLCQQDKLTREDHEQLKKVCDIVLLCWVLKGHPSNWLLIKCFHAWC